MKATLEFNLPEDQAEFNFAVKAADYYIILWEIDQELRRQLKYNSDNLTDEAYKALEDLRDLLREKMIDRGVTFE